MGSTIIIWAISPIVPAAVKAAKAREWPTVPIRRGAHQQPMKKPKKCAEPSVPTSAVEKPSSTPESASSGATPPVPSCNRMTERKRAAKEISRRMGERLSERHHNVPVSRQCPEQNWTFAQQNHHSAAVPPDLRLARR